MRLSLLMFLLLCSCSTSSWSQNAEAVRARYTKYEYRIPMRDGARLFTAVYVPKDSSQKYPFLLTRTPYSVGPYGVDNYPDFVGPSQQFEQEQFIFVRQDARGRYMSEGEFLQVHPHNPTKRGMKDVDESTDTYDTIEWLLKNVPNNNGRVGMVGVSQPGFHVAASMIDSHPALKAASPQAPTADYYLGDDVYHNGAFMLAANFGFYSFFVPRKGGPEPPKDTVGFDPGTPDGYDFYLHVGQLSTVNKRLLKGEAKYLQEIIDHTTYDEFWKSRSIWKFMNNVKCAVLNVGGWFDAEDPSGPFHVYRAVEKNNPGTVNQLVMGPWPHGGWSWGPGDKLGNLHFATKTGEFFRDQIELPFFAHYLKDKPANLPKAYMFLTGVNEWRRQSAWPPVGTKPKSFYFRSGGRLNAEPAGDEEGFDEYVSDPNRPVPFLSRIEGRMTYDYITEDQRFASQRPDVIVYQTEPLEDDLIVAGLIRVKLNVSTTGTDSDFVVKLVDVYPTTYPSIASEGRQQAAKMGGYQQLVRGEPFRGKYRKSFETPEPFTPGKPELIEYSMPDVYHAFRRGHRIMIQIQSTWFPLVDRNPQKFMDIPKADAADFQKATQRIYRTKMLPSSITVGVESNAPR